MVIHGVTECRHTCPFGVIFVTHGKACGTGGTRGAGGPAAAPARAEAATLSWRRMALPYRRPRDRRCQRIHGVHERAGVLPPGPGRVRRAAAAGGHRRVRDLRRELPGRAAGAAAQATSASGRLRAAVTGVGGDRRGLRAAGVGGRGQTDGTRRRGGLARNRADLGHGDQRLRRGYDDRTRSPLGDGQEAGLAGPHSGCAAGELNRKRELPGRT